MSMSPKAKSGTCPLCRKPEMEGFAPFCSRGCKDRDLLKWLGEGYKMPGPSVEYDDMPDSHDDG